MYIWSPIIVFIKHKYIFIIIVIFIKYKYICNYQASPFFTSLEFLKQILHVCNL